MRPHLWLTLPLLLALTGCATTLRFGVGKPEVSFSTNAGDILSFYSTISRDEHIKDFLGRFKLGDPLHDR